LWQSFGGEGGGVFEQLEIKILNIIPIKIFLEFIKCMYVELNFSAIITQEFVSLFVKLISRKISVIFYKIFSALTENRSKTKRYSVFPAVNSSKQRITAVGKEFAVVDESIPFG